MGRSVVQQLKAVLQLLLAWGRRLSSTHPLRLILALRRWLFAETVYRPPDGKRGGNEGRASSPLSGDIVRIDGDEKVTYASDEPAVFPVPRNGRSRSRSPLSLNISTSSHPHPLSPVSEGGESPYRFRVENPSEDSVQSSRLTHSRAGSSRSEHLSVSISRPASPTRSPRPHRDDRLSRLVTASASRRRNRSQSRSRNQTPATSTTTLSRTLQHEAFSRTSFASSAANVAAPAHQIGRDPKRCQKTYPVLETGRYTRREKLQVALLYPTMLTIYCDQARGMLWVYNQAYADVVQPVRAPML